LNKLLILFTLILAATGVSGGIRQCSPFDSNPSLYFTHIRRENGLPSDVVNCAIQDFQGYIWLGTTNGLVRYDGHDMKVFRSVPGESPTLIDNSIYALCQSGDSTIWIGTPNGLSRYNPKTKTITNFPFDDRKPGSFPVSMIYSLYEDDKGAIWVATGNGLERITANGRMFEHVQISNCDNPQKREYNLNHVTSICSCPGNTSKLLIGTMGGLLLFDKDAMKVDRDFHSPSPTRTIIRGMLPDSNFRVWVYGWGMGISCFDLRKESWEVFSSGANNITILSMIHKNKNEIWLATDGIGLGIFNKRSGKISFHKHDPGDPKSISSDAIQGGAYFNNHKDFWIWGEGVDIENPELFSFQQVKIPYRFWWVSACYKEMKTGKVFMGVYQCKGLPVFDTKKMSWSLVKTDTPLPADGLSVNQFYNDSHDILWVSTRNGLYYYSTEKNLLVKYIAPNGNSLKLNDKVVYGLNEDADGNLWIGTRFNGVFQVDKDRKTIKQFTNNPIDPFSLVNGTHFLSIKTDKFKRTWFGCKNGISIYDPLTKKFDNSLMDTLLKYGITKRWINGLETDTLGRMWVAIDALGLVRVDLRPNGSFGIKMYHSGNGMNDPGTGMIANAPDGSLWVVNNGLLYVNPYTDRFQIIDNTNGLHDNPNGPSRVFIDNAGNIYLVDSVGFETRNIYITENAKRIPVKLVIESVEINGKISSEEFSDGTRSGINLNANQNNMTFRYTAICFRYPAQIHYRYKLLGYDKEWVIAETSREARYTNLPPGSFSFIVSVNQGSGWFDIKKPVHFIIHPFFWQTWWFVISCFLLITSLFAIIYKYRVRHLLQVERLRTRIATDLHDDVSSTLSSISILSDIVASHTDNPKTGLLIGEIGSSAKEMLERIDDIIWSVNPANDKFQDLGLRIREYAIPLFESRQIHFIADMPESLDTLKLQMDVRRNIYLIAKEGLNNLVKYAQAENASLTFRTESGQLVLEITDDGKGFDPSLQTKRNGLKNMQKRASQIHGILNIWSQPGKGSSIMLKVRTI